MHNQVRTNRDMNVIKIGLHKGDYELKLPICNNILEENKSLCTNDTLKIGSCIYTQDFVFNVINGMGIRGTQVKSFIQDIVDEVAPIKKAPLWD